MRVVDTTSGLNFDEIDALLAPADLEESPEKAVSDILKAIRERGDVAVCEYTKRFDAYDLTPELMQVPAEQIENFAADADDELVDILRHDARNIRKFHEQQLDKSWESSAGVGVKLAV